MEFRIDNGWVFIFQLKPSSADILMIGFLQISPHFLGRVRRSKIKRQVRPTYKTSADVCHIGWYLSSIWQSSYNKDETIAQWKVLTVATLKFGFQVHIANQNKIKVITNEVHVLPTGLYHHCLLLTVVISFEITLSVCLSASYYVIYFNRKACPYQQDDTYTSAGYCMEMCTLQ